MKTNNKGGKRKGAGRPKGKETKTLSYRVPASLAELIDANIKELIRYISDPRVGT